VPKSSIKKETQERIEEARKELQSANMAVFDRAIEALVKTGSGEKLDRKKKRA